jgi:hypothetical protein
MSQTKIDKLTPEQEAQIPVIREKWKAIALSTERIDRQKASEAIKAAYAIIGKQEPEIVFFDSPLAALSFLESHLGSQLESQLQNQLGSELKGKLEKELDEQVASQLDDHLIWQLNNELINELRSQLERQLWSELESQLKKQLGSQLCSQLGSELHKFVQTAGCLCLAVQLDFYISVVNCVHNPRTWEAYKLLVIQGSCIFAFEKVCLLCDRPLKLSIDSEERLHAQVSPAIEFVDGFFRKYVYEGVEIPEKYGRLHPHQWQAQWLLEEGNAEVRRLLIQVIGYDRICTELQATQLDSEQEYTLLKIDDADVEPIYLLKMTCPSTGFIHALRVPPNISSAREAIRWVNWGIDPLEFAVQT